MSANEHADRPNRLVMALGIVTIILFSANLIAMLSTRVWPRLMDLGLFNGHKTTEEVVPTVETMRFHLRGTPHEHSIIKIGPGFRIHAPHDRCSKRMSDAELSIVGEDIKRETSRLARELAELERELSSVDQTRENDRVLSLKLDGSKLTLLNSPNKSVFELKREMDAVTREFKVRTQQRPKEAGTPGLKMKTREY